MPISITRYVDINSTVAGAVATRPRSLIGRLFTDNPKVPTSSVLEFESADEVGDYFGLTSEEYLRAVFYFGRISKNGTRAQKISYARWTDDDVAPLIYGYAVSTTLAEFQAVTDGTFQLTLGTTTNPIGPINFSAAANLAAVAALIEDAIQVHTGTQWTAATVAYDTSIGGSFNFVGGDAVAAAITVGAGTTGTDISEIIGWRGGVGFYPTNAIFSAGKLEESITATLTLSAQISNDFGSFLFIPEINEAHTIEAAMWNSGQNIKYQYHVAVSLDNAEGYSEDLIATKGVSLTYAPLDSQYPEMCSMIILASTDYNLPAASQNYMYQIFDALTPSVSADSDADFFDDLRINYYGRTQNAGRNIDFYQRGLLMGSVETDPVDMNVYANEQWLKAALTAACMNLLIAVNQVSPNAAGRVQILAVAQNVIITALLNGTISVGADLTPEQIAEIGELSGDLKAWHQVQNIGYWINVVFEIDPDQETIQYLAKIILIYKKNDAIRKVIGDDILI